ncbi:hypothetical protein MXD61_24275 [Frankia sp. AgPm24]|uniref:Molecular chaperone DnaJ n=1 Tax=Frankia umida TaxID=573489 RepID=A0ABT0K064_9ACTN|nr:MULTISPECIES: hypothetical protein [Frankia]MCK9876678.1 hypothetical protein [Frankia umida]MCK9924945.1 hypothetical protein [Frankia sp. AgPm24]
MVWNRRGNTDGGASSGRGGTKRGGSPPVVRDDGDRHRRKAGGDTGDRPVEFGDCSTCNGKGEIESGRQEVDEDGRFLGNAVVRCLVCDGTGRVGT